MSQPQPSNDDAILGGNNPPPVNAAVLGGFAGVKQRLESESIAERLQALNHAIVYGDRAIDLAVRSLTDKSIEVQCLASKLLRYRLGSAGEEALYRHASDINSHYNPFNQQRQPYDPKIGITDPEDTTYVVRVESSNEWGWVAKNIKSLTNDLNLKKLRSVIIQLDSSSYLFYHSSSILELLNPILTKNITPSLKSIVIKCHNPNECNLEYAAQDEILRCLHNSILDSEMAGHNLKYFNIDLLGYGSIQYIRTHEKSELDKLKIQKPIDIVSNLRVSFGD